MGNMNNNDNNGFVGGFVRGFLHRIFFGALIIVGLLIVIVLAL